MAKRKSQPVKKRDAIKVVIKDNQLVEAKYMFNIWETRFFLTLITMIEKEDEEDKVYRIWFKDIKNNFKINSNKSYDLLREAAISLGEKSVDIPRTGDTGLKRNTKRRLLQFVDYLEKGQTGENIVKEEYIDVAIDKEIQPFLLHVKKNFDPKITRYTRYDLRNAEKLKPYAVRIYELMKQFESNGFRTIKIQDLKEMFLITDEYKRFSTFNQSVILPSIKAINKHTDILIPLDRIEHIKKGRVVHAIRFAIISKSQREIDEMRGVFSQSDEVEYKREEKRKPTRTKVEIIDRGNTESNVDKLFTEFEEVIVKVFGVTPSVFMRLLNTGSYNKEAIEQAIRVTRRAKYNQVITKNIAGFFIKALKEEYTDVKEEKEKKKNVKSLVRKGELEKQLKNLKVAKSTDINKIIKKLTSENPNLSQQAVSALSEKALTKIVIEAEEAKLGRLLEMEDFRQIKMLRELVKGKIVELENQHFIELITQYDIMETRLKKELEKY